MTHSLTIHQMPKEERPRERLTRYGSQALSSSELIAILLGNGTRGSSVIQLAQVLLSHFGSLESLADATVIELCQVKGIGQAKAIQLKAAFDLGRRALVPKEETKPRLDTPIQAYKLFRDSYAYAKQENFIVVLQDVKGYLICWEVVAVGTLTETLVHPREVFYPAIRHKAATLLVVHNHPSGDPEPSEEDLAITRKLCEVGKVMDIPLVDHLIITPTKYVSLRERGIKYFH